MVVVRRQEAAIVAVISLIAFLTVNVESRPQGFLNADTITSGGNFVSGLLRSVDGNHLNRFLSTAGNVLTTLSRSGFNPNQLADAVDTGTNVVSQNAGLINTLTSSLTGSGKKKWFRKINNIFFNVIILYNKRTAKNKYY